MAHQTIRARTYPSKTKQSRHDRAEHGRTLTSKRVKIER